MSITYFSRLAAVLGLTVGLSACVDASMEIEVLSTKAAKGTMVMAMEKSMYEMGQSADDSSDGFCDDGTLEITEDNAICTTVKEGGFDELTFDTGSEEEERISITSVGNGLIRVVFPTGNMSSEMGGEDTSDPEMAKMMETFLTGHYLTMKVSGGEIVESNMEVAADGQSAELKIALVDLINSEAGLPAEVYAVVKK